MSMVSCLQGLILKSSLPLGRAQQSLARLHFPKLMLLRTPNHIFIPSTKDKTAASLGLSH